MSQVVKNNRGFLQFLAVCPAHQRQFLLRTASPQQLHALVQVLYNILKEYILIPEENKRNVLPYEDALVNLTETNVRYKKRKRILVQEGDGFIQNLLVPAVTSLGFLMLWKRKRNYKLLIWSSPSINAFQTKMCFSKLAFSVSLMEIPLCLFFTHCRSRIPKNNKIDAVKNVFIQKLNFTGSIIHK